MPRLTFALFLLVGCSTAAPDPTRTPAGPAAEVLLFVGHDCPISNHYAPEMARVIADYSPRGVAFRAVYVDSDLPEADARKHAADYGLACDVVADPALALARKVGATVKPEAAVLRPDGSLAYLGRIDDRYIDYGKRREHVTRRDLRDAIDAVLAGSDVRTPRAPAIGCDIVYPEK